MFAVSNDGTSWRAILDASDLLPGETLSETEPVPTVASIVQRFTPELQAYMDGVAQQNGYDSVVSCVSYKDSGVAQWAQDAMHMVAWRDAIWQWGYAQQGTLDGMTPEQVAALTPDYIIAQAPKPGDFGWEVHAPGAPTA